MMRKYLCKIFSFLLDLVGQVVDLVANTLIKIGTAAVDVLSEVAGAVGNAFLKNPVALFVIGLGAYMIISRLAPPSKEEEREERVVEGVTL